MDRRRGPPSPPSRRGGSFRDPRGGDPFEHDREEYDGGGSFRRRRSPSPTYDRYRGRGGSPHPPPKRGRRDEQGYSRYGGRDESPDYRGGYRGGDRDDRRRGPEKETKLTFKEFMLARIQDDPSPEEAQARYKQYLVEFHGGEIKFEFEERKNDDETRQMFDPRYVEKALVKRNEESKDSALQFASDLEAGKLDASMPNFNQGLFDLAPEAISKKENPAAVEGEDASMPDQEGDAPKATTPKQVPAPAEPPVFAPAVCWRPARVAVDISLAERLIRKLDSEKGLECPLLARPAIATISEEAKAPIPDAPEAMDQPADASAVAPPDASSEEPPAGGNDDTASATDTEVSVNADNLDESLDRLDLLLTYVWRVHGVDYYAGYELTPTEFGQRLVGTRILRGPRPDTVAEGAPSEGEGADLVEQTVNLSLERRISQGDPLEAKCQRKRVEEAVNQWIDSQVIEHTESKWGNKLSNKNFLAKKFVVKHIKTKFDELIQAEKEKVYDEIYFEHFKAFKEEEAKAREAEGNAGGHPHALPGGSFRGGRGGMRGGRGGGRFPHGMVMGGRGMMMGRGGGGAMMMVDPSAMGMGMGMVPMGVMPMAGGGPMMVMLPAGAGAHGMMMPSQPVMGGRGRGRGGAMRGGRAGPGGRGGGGGGGREYYDLDDPSNARSLLDYGDL